MKIYFRAGTQGPEGIVCPITACEYAIRCRLPEGLIASELPINSFHIVIREWPVIVSERRQVPWQVVLRPVRRR